MLTVNDVFGIISPRFNENFLFEHFADDEELFEAFDKFMFSLVEEGEFDGYDIIRAEWMNKTDTTFHFTVEGCDKIIVLNCTSESTTTH